MNRFLRVVLQQFADQLRYTPVERRREQLIEAQKLLGEIKIGNQYPYSYVCYRITGYRSQGTTHDELIHGLELQHDLALVAKVIERSLPVPNSEDTLGPCLTLEEISKRFNVSTKTISRWRVRGLVGTRVVKGGRRQLVFPLNVVESFLKEHAERVERSGRFTHLTEEEKLRIIRHANRFARAGATLTDTSRRIAKCLNRSMEAIRYTIRNHDDENPEQAMFIRPNRRLEATEEKATQRRVSSMKKAASFGPQNVLVKERNMILKPVPLDFIPNADFENPNLESEFLADMPNEAEFVAARANMRAPKDIPAELASLYEWPLLSREQEAHLFRKMNFLKFKLHKLKNEPTGKSRDNGKEAQIGKLERNIQEVKTRLINCNMRLVASIAKKHSNQHDNLFELISDGNISLIRAVEKFDYARGNKFSTYASWAIMKNYARSIPDEKKVREHYLTGAEEVFDIKADIRSDEQEMLNMAEQAKNKVTQLLEGLDQRTRQVICLRNGLDGSEEMTLEQIGKLFGITKERVRQINVRGMKQLRERALVNSIELAN